MDHNALNLTFAALAIVCGICEKNAGRKTVWAILCSGALLHLSANIIIFDRIDEYWEHIAFATMDFAILYLLSIATQSTLQRRQMALVCILWATDWVLYLDLRAETSLVYGHYENINLSVEAMQLALGANGVIRGIKKLALGLASPTPSLGSSGYHTNGSLKADIRNTQKTSHQKR